MHTWDHFHSLFRLVPRLPEAVAPGPLHLRATDTARPSGPPLLHQPRPLLDTRRASTEPSGQGWRETAFISSLLLFSLYKPPSPSRRPPSSDTGAPRGTLQCAPPLDAGSPKAIRGSWPGSQASVVLRCSPRKQSFFFFFPLKTNKKIYIYIFIFSCRVAPEQVCIVTQSVDSPNLKLRIEARSAPSGLGLSRGHSEGRKPGRPGDPAPSSTLRLGGQHQAAQPHVQTPPPPPVWGQKPQGRRPTQDTDF